jgi:hypothetical protein
VRELRDIAWSLDVLRPELNAFQGEERDTVFDMYAIESALAGIASRRRDKRRRRLPPDQLKFLKRKLIDGSIWQRADGTKHDLKQLQELIDFGLVLDELRATLLATALPPATPSVEGEARAPECNLRAKRKLS